MFANICALSFLIMPVIEFIPPIKLKLTAFLDFKKQAFKGGEKSQLQMTKRKTSSGEGNKAQLLSEQQDQGKSVQYGSVQMSKRFRFFRM